MVKLSAYKEANNYPNVLKKIIEEGWYTLQQVFNVMEIGLCWKHKPDRTFISTKEKMMKYQQLITSLASFH